MTTSALALLLSTRHPELAKINVQGNIIKVFFFFLNNKIDKQRSLFTFIVITFLFTDPRTESFSCKGGFGDNYSL